MNHRFLFARLALALTALAITTVATAEPVDLSKLTPRGDNADARVVSTDDGRAFEVRASGGDYPGVQLNPGDTPHDFADYGALEFDIVNTGDRRARIHARAENPGPWQDQPWSINAMWLNPGESGTLRVNFGQAYGNPAYKLDASNITRYLVFAEKPKGPVAFRVTGIHPVGSPARAVSDGAVTPNAEGDTAELLELQGDDAVRLKPSSGQVNAEAGQSGIDAALLITIQPGDDGYPGLGIMPGQGEAWDLSNYGHIAAELTNDGEKDVRVHVRVDNNGDWKKNPWSTEARTVKRGETRTIKVIFGHSYGYKPSYDLDPSAISQVLLFTDKKKDAVSLRLNKLTAGGPAGEKPAVNPANVRVDPDNGVMLGQGVNASSHLAVEGRGVQSSASADAIEIAFDGKDAYAHIKPAVGKWRLTDATQVEVTVRNVGDRPVTPLARVRSDRNQGPGGSADSPVAPGQTATLIATFESGKPWVGPDKLRNGHLSGQPGTGNEIRSDAISDVALGLKESQGRLRVEQITAVAPVADVPAWLGQRPPVDGNWTLTFEDDFESGSIDRDKWEIYTANYWDKRSHFTKDNLILEDGVVKLRYEKKRGYMNDDPNDKHPKTGESQTDYAVGYLDTYDKFTQKYGYFEARMKLPEAPGLWPAFWLMPDRGNDDDPRWKRQMTEQGGMEFDIMEHLTRWGPHRFNVAFHWDGYGKNHKATGSTAVYANHDEDGFITAGLLWLPGEAVIYTNGREIGRWENDRIASVPMYVILYMVSGGWDNNALDDSQLPADFEIDYIRVWQRDDLVDR